MNKTKARYMKSNGTADPLRFSQPHHIPYAAMRGLHSSPMGGQFSQPHSYHQPFAGSSNRWNQPGPQTPLFNGSFNSSPQGFITGFSESHGLNMNSASSFYNHQYGQNPSQNFYTNRHEHGPIPSSYTSTYDQPIVVPDIPSSCLRPRSVDSFNSSFVKPKKSSPAVLSTPKKIEKKRKDRTSGTDTTLAVRVLKHRTKRVKPMLSNKPHPLCSPQKPFSSVQDKSEISVSPSDHDAVLLSAKDLQQNEDGHAERKEISKQTKSRRRSVVSVSPDPNFGMSLRSVVKKNKLVASTATGAVIVQPNKNCVLEPKVAHLVKLISDAAELVSIAADQLREMFPALNTRKSDASQEKAPTVALTTNPIRLMEPLTGDSGKVLKSVYQNTDEVESLRPSLPAEEAIHQTEEGGKTDSKLSASTTMDVTSIGQQNKLPNVSSASKEIHLERKEQSSGELSQQSSLKCSEQSFYSDEWDSSDQITSSHPKKAAESDIANFAVQIKAAWVPVAMDE